MQLSLVAVEPAPQQQKWAQAPPQAPPGCPPGLEYLTQVDQLIVNQQIELLEGKCNAMLLGRKLLLHSLQNFTTYMHKHTPSNSTEVSSTFASSTFQ